MAKAHQAAWLSPQEYLQGELHGDIKHEYVAGYVYAMVGSSEPHNLIAGNLYAILHSHLRGKSCRVFISDMKVRAQDAFYYPDLMVCCDADDTDLYVKTKPALIIEILSPGTERIDRHEKRDAYQTLDSLVEYVLIAQDKQAVSLYRRNANLWELETYKADDRFYLKSVALHLALEQIYEDVKI